MDEDMVLVRLGVKHALGNRGAIVSVTPAQLADLGIYADVLEPGEAEWLYRVPTPPTPPAPVADALVWGDPDDEAGDGDADDESADDADALDAPPPGD